jgi:hypothetical protein
MLSFKKSRFWGLPAIAYFVLAIAALAALALIALHLFGLIGVFGLLVVLGAILLTGVSTALDDNSSHGR